MNESEKIIKEFEEDYKKGLEILIETNSLHASIIKTLHLFHYSGAVKILRMLANTGEQDITEIISSFKGQIESIIKDSNNNKIKTNDSK